MEYGEIIKGYAIPKGNDVTLNEVWNVFKIQKVPDPNLNIKSGRKKGVESQTNKKTSGKAGEKAKEDFLENDEK